MSSKKISTPDERPHQVGGQNPAHQSIVEKAVREAESNKGPGQKNDPNKGFIKLEKTNPRGTNPFMT